MVRKDKKDSRMELFLTKFAIPAIIIGVCVYFFLEAVVRNNVNKTTEDIVALTRKMAENYENQQYKFLSNDAIALGEFLPYDLVKEEGEHYTLSNRFGGQIHVMESVSNQKERTLYFSLYNNQKQYQKVYDGVGAYVVLLTNLTAGICKTLAQIDWPAKIPNFMGIEAAYTTPTSQNNGVYNLSNYILTDNEGETPKNTVDLGIAQRRPLSEKEAQKACGCFWHSCSVALKFR